MRKNTLQQFLIFSHNLLGLAKPHPPARKDTRDYASAYPPPTRFRDLLERRQWRRHGAGGGRTTAAPAWPPGEAVWRRARARPSHSRTARSPCKQASWRPCRSVLSLDYHESATGVVLAAERMTWRQWAWP